MDTEGRRPITREATALAAAAARRWRRRRGRRGRDRGIRAGADGRRWERRHGETGRGPKDRKLTEVPGEAFVINVDQAN